MNINERARQALAIQDACNGCAVARVLNEAMCELLALGLGTDAVNSHPTTQVLISKLADLAHVEHHIHSTTWTAVEELANVAENRIS